MDTPQVSVRYLEAVEEGLYPSQESDEVGFRGGESLEIRHKWARPLVELRGLSHESMLP